MYRALHNKSVDFSPITMSFNSRNKDDSLQQRGAVNNKYAALVSHKTPSMKNKQPNHIAFSSILAMFK